MIIAPLLLLLLLLLGIGVALRRYKQRHRRRLLRQLRQWLGAQTIDDPHLQRWVNGLSQGEADVLFDLLTGYCASLNWELTWLFTPQLQKVPSLQQAIEEGVTTYVRSILTALQLEGEVHAYKTYSRLVQKPGQRKQFTLIQKLYQEFSRQGLITPDPKARRWFRRSPTRKQKISAVLAAFEHKPAPAMTSLKTLLAQEAQADAQQLTGIPLAMSTAASF